jgi:hypothetical protein
MLRSASLSACVLLLCTVAACGPAPAPAQLSDAAIAVRDALPEDRFRGPLGGAPVELLAQDCKVFGVTRGVGQEVTLTEVLAPAPYPFFTGCERQSLREEDGAVIAVLGRRAFGAGGCCATGGTWRTRDGKTWEKTSGQAIP